MSTNKEFVLYCWACHILKIRIPTSHKGLHDPSDDVKTRQSFVADSNTCFLSVKTSPCALCVYVWVVLFNRQVPDGCRCTGFCKPKSIPIRAHAVWIPPWRSLISMWRVKLQVMFKEQVWTCAGRRHETCAPTVCSKSLLIFKLFVQYSVVQSTFLRPSLPRGAPPWVRNLLRLSFRC